MGIRLWLVGSKKPSIVMDFNILFIYRIIFNLELNPQAPRLLNQIEDNALYLNLTFNLLVYYRGIFFLN